MYVITHKQFNYPLPPHYCPILVGADFNSNPADYQPDNTGDNISSKNKSYCELTGLYWIWKNTNDDKIGLSHYRRYFSQYTNRKGLDLQVLLTGNPKPITTSELNKQLTNNDWIVSQPEKSVSDSLKQDFANYHHVKDLETTRQVIEEKYPDYLKGFDQVLNSNRASYYNMFYTRRTELNKYCSWLFDILFDVEKRTDISNYDQYQQRLFGFLAERLLNVWITATHAKVTYLAEYQTDILDRQEVIQKVKQKLKHLL